MEMRKILGALMLVGCCQGSAMAGDVMVHDAWVRATVPGQQATGAFMTLKASSAAELIGAESKIGMAEVHEMAMQKGTDGKGVMTMRQVPSVALPAGKAVVLEPGGYHVMLMGLKAQVKTGEQVELTLKVRQDGEVKSIPLTAPVRALTASKEAAVHGGMKKH